MAVGISNNFVNIQEKPAFCGTKAMKQANKWRRSLKHIDLIPNSPVSDAFVKEKAQGIHSMDYIGQKIIKGQETRFALAQKASHIFPDLKGNRCPGWPKGTTWDNLRVIYRDEILGLLEKPVKSKKADVGNVTVEDIRHEVGHEFHRYFKKVIGIDFTETEGFTKAYLKDIKNLPENMKKYGKKVENADYYLDYIIQGSTPQKADDYAKKEAFAEIYADLNGGGYQEKFSKGMAKLHEKIFPNTYAYVEKLLGLLGKR